MKKIFKKTLFLIFILVTFNACQSVKDGLTGVKQTNTDEFLIEKKNPLVLPPEFNKLPVPRTSNENNEEIIDVQSILTKRKSPSKKKSINKTSNSSLEKSILEKIKK